MRRRALAEDFKMASIASSCINDFLESLVVLYRNPWQSGFNSTLRQDNITHHEYIQVGKGRDVGLNQIALFEGKVAGGNGEQVLSRDEYKLGQLFYFFRCSPSISQLLVTIFAQWLEVSRQMEKWMGACNCIITKAGSGTIAEALIRGFPIILNDYILGQVDPQIRNQYGQTKKSSVSSRSRSRNRKELKALDEHLKTHVF